MRNLLFCNLNLDIVNEELLVQQREYEMRISVTLDDELVAMALKLTGIERKSDLVREGLKLLIARESARRLALLGGTEPDALAIPRRRSQL